VLVAGGFHRRGGMDRLNLALARHLIDRGNRVHLVCHSVEPALREGSASVHVVSKPGGSFMLGEFLLATRGRRIARLVSAQSAGTRVVVNGGNCAWPDVNWVHCVHHAWERSDGSSPAWFRLKNFFARRRACGRERSGLTRARILIANSERTRRDLVNHLGIGPDRIHVVYPGSDSSFAPPTAVQRAAARAWLEKDGRPLVAFVGALGHDSNKGLDVLVSAWRKLCARPDWDADLIVAGYGRAAGFWQRQVALAGLGGRISVLGFTDRVPELLAAVDLLVSPVRYEAYGLNVQEAICCGLPAMVAETAGIAECYPEQLRELLIRDPEDVNSLAAKILQWSGAVAHWKKRIMPFSETLRRHTLEAMAQQIIAIAETNVMTGQQGSRFEANHEFGGPG
jgi:glycosyltransferase involved in cell wall biosynthesis